MPGDQHVSTVTQQQRSSSCGPDPVGNKRANDTADSSGQNSSPQVEPPLEGQKAGEWHDELAGQRNATALDGHRKDDAGIAKGREKVEQVMGNRAGHDPRFIFSGSGAVPRQSWM